MGMVINMPKNLNQRGFLPLILLTTCLFVGGLFVLWYAKPPNPALAITFAGSTNFNGQVWAGFRITNPDYTELMSMFETEVLSENGSFKPLSPAPRMLVHGSLKQVMGLPSARERPTNIFCQLQR
jgi:hypothetical protein